MLDCRYGYVTPDDVPAILDQHIAKGEIIERLWRFVLYIFCHRGILFRVLLMFLPEN